MSQGAIEAEIFFDPSRTRACVVTAEGEYVCSRITIHGDQHNPDSITLVGVGKTESLFVAKIWLLVGIAPSHTFEKGDMTA